MSKVRDGKMKALMIFILLGVSAKSLAIDINVGVADIAYRFWFAANKVALS